jgi:hypothetical protein
MYEYMEGSRMVSCLFGTTVVLCGATCYTLHFRLGSSLLLLYIYMETEIHCNYKQANSLYIPHCLSFRSRVILSKVLWHVWKGICRSRRIHDLSLCMDHDVGSSLVSTMAFLFAIYMCVSIYTGDCYP